MNKQEIQPILEDGYSAIINPYTLGSKQVGGQGELT